MIKSHETPCQHLVGTSVGTGVFNLVVPHVHDGVLPLNMAESGSFNIIIPPYQAMKVGDKLSYSWQGFFDDGTEDFPLEKSYTIKSADIGFPVSLTISKSDLAFQEGGNAEVFYTLNYGNGKKTQSGVVSINVMATQNVPLLPPVLLPSGIDDEIDPALFPDGLNFEIPVDTNKMNASDGVILRWKSASAADSVNIFSYIDPSVIDSGRFTLNVPFAWIQKNTGKTVLVSYSVSGENLWQSEELSLSISSSLSLIRPEITGVVPEGSGTDTGYIRAASFADGVTVSVAQGMNTGIYPVELHWKGITGNDAGYFISSTPEVGKPGTFKVPGRYIASAMSDNEHFEVFWRIHISEEFFTDSASYLLRVAPVDTSLFPKIQCTEAQGTGSLSKKALGSANATLSLQKWMLMAEGQFLNITVSHLSLGSVEVRNGSKPVTAAEVLRGSTQDFIPNAFILRVPNNSSFSINASLSFNAGHSQFALQQVNITVVS